MEKVSNLEKDVAVLKVTVSERMSNFDEKLDNLTKLVTESNAKVEKNNEKFLSDVKEFISSFVGNYVPINQWNEHIKEDAVNEGKLNALFSEVDKIKIERGKETAVKGVYLKGWNLFIYPVAILIITIIVTFLLNKFLGL